MVLKLATTIGEGPDKQIEPLFSGPGRKLVAITLRNNAILESHKAAVPVSIHCVAGSGALALEGTEGEVDLVPGVLVTLEANRIHAVRARGAVSLLLTQFLGGGAGAGQ